MIIEKNINSINSNNSNSNMNRKRLHNWSESQLRLHQSWNHKKGKEHECGLWDPPNLERYGWPFINCPIPGER